MLKGYAKKAWRGISIAAAVTAGFIIFPLTIPFLKVADHFRRSEDEHRRLWKKYEQKHKRSKWYYFQSISHIVGVALLNVLKTFWVFAKSFVLSFRNAAVIGYRKGLLAILKTPSDLVNEYTIGAKKINGNLYFRPQHLLKMALIIGVLAGIAFTIAALVAPAAFAPLSWLGLHFASHALTGIMTFVLSTALISALTAALQVALHTFIRFNHAVANFFKGLLYPSSKNGKRLKNRVKFALSRLGYFFDEVLAVALGVPIYLLFKPLYQIIHSVRAWYKSSKQLWRSNKKVAESKNSFFKEYAIKVGTLFAMLGNMILRLVILPFQALMSALYAPYQAVRHATKYGLAHVLNYPVKYVNNYRPGLFVKDDKPYRGNAKKNYKNIKLAQYKNVSYFSLKHLFMLAILAAITLAILTHFIPSLGFIAINLSVKLATPLGLGSFALSGVFHGIVNLVIGFVGTYAVAAALFIASKVFKFASWLASTIHRLIKKQSTFKNLFHKEVEPGEAFKVMKKENLLVKTIASTVKRDHVNVNMPESKQRVEKYGVSWVFNIDQLKNPSGFYLFEKNRPTPLKKGETPRPVYFVDDPNRKYARNKTYKKLNPKTGEWEEKKMGGERGRARFDMWLKHYLTFGLVPMKTKKTCVSLAPKDGMMAYYGGRDDAIAFALDLNKLSKKDNKYIFSGDAWSNLKWWWRSKYDDHKHRAVRSVTNQQLRNDNKSKRRQNNVPSHNERIVRIHKQALCAIIVSTRRRQDRINGLLRKLIIKYELGIDLPIILAGTLSSNHAPAMPPEEYTVEQQLVDLYIASKTNLDQASKKTYDKVAKHYANTKGHGHFAKKSFCRTLVNSNRINWATVFKHVDDEHQISRGEFKQYIKSAAKVELGGTTSRKFMPTHFVPR